MKRKVSLNLSGQVTKFEMQEFLNEVPEGVGIEAHVTVIPADRPWETTHTRVELQAEWDGTRQEIADKQRKGHGE